MTDERPGVAAEPLSPLAALVDRALHARGYDAAATIEAVDDAVPGVGGLFDPNTGRGELTAALEGLLADDADDADDAAGADAGGDGTGGAGPPRRRPDLDGARVICYTDGSSRGTPGPAGAGAVLRTAAGEPVARLARPVGSRAGNNLAEYAALYLGLDGLPRCSPVAVEVRIDSRTVIDDVWGDAGSGVDGAARYREGIRERLAAIPDHGWTHLADHEPNPADARATVAADLAALGPG